MSSNINQRLLIELIESMPMMEYRCLNDRTWTLESVSDGCQSVTGYTVDELLGPSGQQYLNLIHEDDRDKVWRGVQSALGKQAPFRILYRIITAAGEEQQVLSVGRGVFSPDGNLYAVVGFIISVMD